MTMFDPTPSRRRHWVAAVLAFVLLAGPAMAEPLLGAGATFPYPLYAKWAEAYKQKTGIAMNYQSIGSGGGIKQIEAKTVDFGASDMPLKPEDLDRAGLTQFPMIMGGVVPVVNLRGRNRHMGRSLHHGAQSRRHVAGSGDRCGSSLRRFGDDLHLHQLSFQDQPELEKEGRIKHRCRLAHRARRKGQ
jgi:hypothetical protein